MINAWCQCGHRPCCVRLVRRVDVAVELGRWPETATLMWRVSTLAPCLKASSLIWLSDFIGLPLRRCAYPTFNVRPRGHAATSHVWGSDPGPRLSGGSPPFLPAPCTSGAKAATGPGPKVRIARNGCPSYPRESAGDATADLHGPRARYRAFGTGAFLDQGSSRTSDAPIRATRSILSESSQSRCSIGARYGLGCSSDPTTGVRHAVVLCRRGGDRGSPLVRRPTRARPRAGACRGQRDWVCRGSATVPDPSEAACRAVPARLPGPAGRQAAAHAALRRPLRGRASRWGSRRSRAPAAKPVSAPPCWRAADRCTTRRANSLMPILRNIRRRRCLRLFSCRRSSRRIGGWRRSCQAANLEVTNRCWSFRPCSRPARS
jgi:hypothetical protein